MANGVGLRNRLEPVLERHKSHFGESAAERIAFSRDVLRAKNLPWDSARSAR
jgi:hypothetical protein